jgi:hypothetical protein
MISLGLTDWPTRGDTHRGYSLGNDPNKVCFTPYYSQNAIAGCNRSCPNTDASSNRITVSLNSNAPSSLTFPIDQSIDPAVSCTELY